MVWWGVCVCVCFCVILLLITFNSKLLCGTGNFLQKLCNMSEESFPGVYQRVLMVVFLNTDHFAPYLGWWLQLLNELYIKDFDPNQNSDLAGEHRMLCFFLVLSLLLQKSRKKVPDVFIKLVCMCVCVCVWERERDCILKNWWSTYTYLYLEREWERLRHRETERKRERESGKAPFVDEWECE